MKKVLFSILVSAVLMFGVSSIYAATYEIIDTMDSVDGWGTHADLDATVALTTTAGYTDDAVVLTYAFNSGTWLGMHNTSLSNSDWSTAEAIRYYIMGTGNSNSIECKVRDSSERTFGTILTQKTNEASWTEVVIATGTFTYFWGNDGGDNTYFDWANVVEITITPAIKDGDEGGSGTLLVDSLDEVIPEEEEEPNDSAEITVTVLNAEISVEVVGSITLGSVVAGGTLESSTSITVTNAGTVPAVFRLRQTNPADWTPSTTQGTDQYVLNGAFATAADQITWSEANHNLTTENVTCTDTIFAGDTNGANVPASESRLVWIQFKAPTQVTNETAHTITITVTAISGS